MLSRKVRSSIRKINSSQRAKTYLGLATVFLASVLVTLYLPIDSVFKGVASIPAVVSMTGALFQIFRDQAAYEKQLELQRKQQFYNLAVTSHMANVAFDKHVEFCEKYMVEVHKTVSVLFHEGPTQKILVNLGTFQTLRSEYAAWLTQDISSKLLPFEDTLKRLGSRTYLVRALTNKLHEGNQLSDSENDRRLQAISEMWSLFESLDLEKTQEQIDENIAVEAIKTRIRTVLGIEELTTIREFVIKEAAYQTKTINPS